MKKFIENNWFRLSILLFLLIYLVIFSSSKQYIVRDEISKDESSLSATTSKEELNILETSNVKNSKLNIKAVENDYAKVSKQLSFFNDFLESSLLDAHINCNVYATYNNVFYNKSMSQSEFQSAFPETQNFYKDKCISAYLYVSQNQKELIAEPELQSLRIILTEYSDEIKSFALYALEDGYEAYLIDKSDKKMDSLRTLAREEIVMLKRKYPF
ncbi:MAG: hypothetical protein FGM57_02555 [Candidatus Taylorbacteria bacterium]|nr:hypothetical protein [Candidatus Taylorbacteria bacterium]